MTKPVLAIVGGGFCGAMVAVHLLRAVRTAIDVVVVEPRATLGAGLAYGSAAPEHRINVPSDKMIVFAEDPLHLTRWVRAEGLFDSDPEAVTAEGHHYARRTDFGRYVASLVDAAVRVAPPGSTLQHRRASATDIVALGSRQRVVIDGGEPVDADAVVVTASHETPAFPWPLGPGVASHRGLVRDPWTELGALDVEGGNADATVVVAGTGLTMCDVVVSLRWRGHRARVLAISRRALLPQAQGLFGGGTDLFGDAPPPTARALLRRVRDAARAATDWREELDATRFALPRLWQALPQAERQRALRWLRPFWDVHRFRMAPQVADLLRGERERGALQVEPGRIRAIDIADDGGLVVAWQGRDGREHRTPCLAFVNCTGPTSDMRRAANPLMRALLAGGRARPDPIGIGLDCDADGRLRGADGVLADRLCVAGPLARAAVAEVTGVPEASAHARRVAERLSCELSAAGADPSSPHPEPPTP
jgi:uncharacterized NAD(P)/FAD-binding protein YdhS